MTNSRPATSVTWQPICPTCREVNVINLSELDPQLLANPTAVLATNGHDGYPQITAVWYVVEDGQICISITESTRKAKNLALDDKCSVLIFHPDTPNYYAEIRGTASTTPDHDYVFADRLGQRYNTDMRSFDRADSRRLRVAIDPAKISVTDVRG